MVIARPPRPTGVTIITVVLYVKAFIGIASGILMIFQRDVSSFQSSTGMDSTELVAAGVWTILFGVITAILAGALGRGSMLMRFLIGIVMVIWLGSAVYAIFAYSGTVLASALVHGGLALVVLYILFGRADVARWFMKA